MLQGLNLPFIEISPLESGSNYSVSLQEQRIEPDTVFADIFKLEPQRLPSLQPGAGNPLPPSGNILPQRLNDVPVAASIEDFESDLPQPEVFATNPLPIELLIPASAPIQVSFDTGGPATPAPASAPTTVPTIAHALAPAATDAAVNLPELRLQGTVKPSVEGRVDTQTMHERANPVLPLDAGSNTLRVATELPVLPISGEAIASVLEQAARTKKTPTTHSNLRPVVEPAGLPKSPTEATRDDNVQGIKPAPSAPIVSQPASIAPVASSNADAGQQIQISPLQVSPVTNRIGTDTSLAQPPTIALIDTPVNEPAWGDRVGDRLLLMAGNKMQSAEIRLTPAELGPLRVRIVVDDGAANVTFNAQHAATREALEQAMPRLRELFAENGLTLQQSSISESDGHGVQQGKQDQDDGQTRADAAARSTDEESAADSSTSGLILKPRSDKLVDTFA